MNDWQQFLNPSILGLLIEDLIDEFLVSYLKALANALKLRMPLASDRIRDDIGAAFEFLSTLKPAKELEAYFDVIDLVLALLEASKSLVFLSFWEFAKIHGPNIAFVESLMKARDDLDRTAVSEVMDSIKRKIKDEDITDRASFITLIFSALHTEYNINTHSTRANYYEENCSTRMAAKPEMAVLITSVVVNIYSFGQYLFFCVVDSY